MLVSISAALQFSYPFLVALCLACLVECLRSLGGGCSPEHLRNVSRVRVAKDDLDDLTYQDSHTS
jgi:hypothetical protein